MGSIVSGVDLSIVGSGVGGGDSGIGGRTGVKGGDGEIAAASGGGTGDCTSIAIVTSERPDSPAILPASPLPVMTNSVHDLLPCLL